jgi:hypothetical protein
MHVHTLCDIIVPQVTVVFFAASVACNVDVKRKNEAWDEMKTREKER